MKNNLKYICTSILLSLLFLLIIPCEVKATSTCTLPGGISASSYDDERGINVKGFPSSANGKTISMSWNKKGGGTNWCNATVYKGTDGAYYANSGYVDPDFSKGVCVNLSNAGLGTYTIFFKNAYTVVADGKSITDYTTGGYWTINASGRCPNYCSGRTTTPSGWSLTTYNGNPAFYIPPSVAVTYITGSQINKTPSSIGTAYVYSHDYTNYRDGGQATAATCTAASTHYKQCKYCTSKSGTYTYGSALGHSYTADSGVQYSAATCTSPRYNYKKCSRCGTNPQNSSYTVAVGSALGHDFTNYRDGGKVSNATCTAAEVHNKQCSRCLTTSGTYTVGTALGHSYTDKYEDSNGVSNGHYWLECSKCADKKSHSYKLVLSGGTGVASFTGDGWYSSGDTATATATAKDGYTLTTSKYTFNMSKAYSQTFLATLNKPTVTTNPSAVTCDTDASTSFSCAATSGDGNVAYQWQQSTDDSTWADLLDSTFNKLTLNDMRYALNNNYYRCACTNASGTTYTNSAKLTVKDVTNPIINNVTQEPLFDGEQPIGWKVVISAKDIDSGLSTAKIIRDEDTTTEDINAADTPTGFYVPAYHSGLYTVTVVDVAGNTTSTTITINSDIYLNLDEVSELYVNDTPITEVWYNGTRLRL